MKLRIVRLSCVVVLSYLSICCAHSAAESPVLPPGLHAIDFIQAPENWRSTLRTRLQVPVKLNVGEYNFNDLIIAISKQTNITIVLDEKVDGKTLPKVNIPQGDLTGEQALGRALSAAKLDWEAAEDTVFLVHLPNLEAAAAEREFDVTDIVGGASSAEPEVVNEEPRRIHKVERIVNVVRELQVFGNALEPIAEQQILINAIRRAVTPDSWTKVTGAALRIESGKLIATNVPDVQERIAVFLKRIRDAREKAIQKVRRDQAAAALEKAIEALNAPKAVAYRIKPEDKAFEADKTSEEKRQFYGWSVEAVKAITDEQDVIRLRQILSNGMNYGEQCHVVAKTGLAIQLKDGANEVTTIISLSGNWMKCRINGAESQLELTHDGASLLAQLCTDLFPEEKK